ncbi:MAG: hypothetical protein V3T18_11045, partial [Pseudomonadales bacterium]
MGKQIRSKSTTFCQFLKSRLCRTDYPTVQLREIAAPDMRESTLLQRTEENPLGILAQVTQLVDKEHTSRGLLEISRHYITVLFGSQQLLVGVVT